MKEKHTTDDKMVRIPVYEIISKANNVKDAHSTTSENGHQSNF